MELQQNDFENITTYNDIESKEYNIRKQYCFELGFVELAKNISIAKWHYNMDPENLEYGIEYAKALEAEQLSNTYCPQLYKMACNLNHNKYTRTKRLYNYMEPLVKSENGYFLTLTFNNETMAKTTEQTRRRYVARTLKLVSMFYIANIDYGDKEKNPDSNEREHYHACILLDNEHLQEPLKELWKQYGFIKIQKIRTHQKSIERVSKYITKLTNHAIKNSGQSKRLIYSKDILKVKHYINIKNMSLDY